MPRKKPIRSSKQFLTCEEKRRTRYVDQQRKRIMACLNADPVDLDTLRLIAFERGGFLNDEMRKRVWPKLLDINVFTADTYGMHGGKHTSDSQIQRDIDRSLWHYTCLRQLTDSERNHKRKCLFGIINGLVSQHSDLFYYQGFHDICSVFLLVQGEKGAFALVRQAATSYFRECMRDGFEPMMEILQLLFPLIQTQDPKLYNFLSQSQVEPYVALPWMITWFAHHIDDFAQVTRLYDAFLSSHPLFSLYCSAALILHHSKRIIASDCDFGKIHNLLASLPKDMDIERVLRTARILFQTEPPDQLLKRVRRVGLSSKTCTLLQYPFEYQLEEQAPDQFLYDQSKSSVPLKRNIKSRTLRKETNYHSYCWAAAAVMTTLTWYIHSNSS